MTEDPKILHGSPESCEGADRPSETCGATAQLGAPHCALQDLPSPSLPCQQLEWRTCCRMGKETERKGTVTQGKAWVLGVLLAGYHQLLSKATVSLLILYKLPT